MPAAGSSRGVSELVRQATCVAIGGRGVLIEGPPGSGKSSLALALIDRGAKLVGDDAVTLAIADGALQASPPPNIRGLLEVRNVGLVTLPVTSAPVALLVRLDPSAPRLPEGAGVTELLGHNVPTLAMYPDASVLALRVEKALELHGSACDSPSHSAGESAHRR